mgnify:CR=1 FL=1
MTQTTVRVQRIMPAPPDAVFDEWLDVESLKDWMCPRPDHCVAVSVEPHVGGRLQFDVAHAGSVVLIIGHFLTIDRPHLLRFTWSNSNWADPTAASIVNVTFEPHGDAQTRMTIEHSLLPSYEHDNFHNGWLLTAEQLETVLRRR